MQSIVRRFFTPDSKRSIEEVVIIRVVQIRIAFAIRTDTYVLNFSIELKIRYQQLSKELWFRVRFSFQGELYLSNNY